MSLTSAQRPFVHPPACVLCESPPHRDLHFCQLCADRLLSLENAWVCCAILKASPDLLLPGTWQRKSPFFDASFAGYQYHALIDYRGDPLNFHGKSVPVQLLGRPVRQALIFNFARAAGLHRARALTCKAARRPLIHVTLELARYVKLHPRLFGDDHVARPIRYSDSLLALPAKLRRKNVRHAFGWNSRKISVRHVAILGRRGHDKRDDSPACVSV